MENRFKIGCHESRKFSSSEIHYRFPYVSPDIIYLRIKNKPVFQFSKQEKQFKTSNYNMLKLKRITQTDTIHNILKPNRRNTNINVFVCKKNWGNKEAYEDVELPIKESGHSAHKLLSLRSNWHVTDWPSNPKTKIIPFIQAPIKLTLIPTTGIHCGSKPHQILHNSIPKK